MNREQMIEAIRTSGQADRIAALEALGPDATDTAIAAIHTALAEATTTPPAPADPATQTTKAAKKKSGKLPVRVGANVSTSGGRGKVTKVEGDVVTVTLASGKTEQISVSALRAHMAVKGNAKKHRVPAAEAADVLSQEDSWDDIASDVRAAVSKKFMYDSPYYPGCYCYCVAVFDDYVIVSAGDDYYRVSWTQDPATDEVTLGDLEDVELQYVTVAGVNEGTILGPLDDDGHVLESGAKPTGQKWMAVFIQEGMSKNRNFYPADVLREAVDLYDNRPIFLDHDPNPSRFGRSVKDAIGFTKQPQVLRLGGTQEAEGRLCIAGQIVINDGAWRTKLVEAWEEGNPTFVGLSHDVNVTGRLVVGDASGPYKRAEKIEECKSVDLVMNPAAGGRLMQMVAANGFTESDLKEIRMLTKMIEAIKASKRADLIAALEALGPNATEDAVMGLHAKIGVALQEAVQTPPPAVTTPAVDPNAPKPLSLQESEELRGFVAATRKQNAMLLIESSVAGCSLPPSIKARVKKRMSAMVEAGQALTQEGIVADLKEEVDAYGAAFEGAVRLPGGGQGSRFTGVTKDTREQFQEALDDFFGMKKDKDGVYKVDPHARAVSFRNLYVQFTGDERVTGDLKEATRLTESLDSGSFSHILGDSITRRMVAEYQLPEFQAWRGLIGDVVPLNDFRVQRRLRFGGYGNLATVAQGAPYLGMTSPTDEEATYSPAKRGGTEAVTLEMIKNDDVGVIKKIPVRLGRAAGQTLYEFVFDFLRLNSTIYDSVALAASGHGTNITTSALSASQVSNARLVMRQQTDMSNGKRLGLKLKYLWVPSDLEDLSRQITGADRAVPDSALAAQAAPAAPNPVRLAGIVPVTVDYWTDTNNWWGTASVDQCPMIEVGFLDGREDPELFVQDQPNVGSLFSNDQITWKIRHIYGGGVLDFRGFFGGIVP